MNRKLLKSSYSVIHYLVISLLALLMVYPILWMLASSLKDNSEVFTNAYRLVPTTWHFDNYVRGWKGFSGYSFTTFFLNSAEITVLSTIGAVCSSAFVAYGFARLHFAGSRYWFVCMMVTMMLPGQVLVIPQYVLFQKLDWINTFLPLIVPPFFGSAFFIFLIMQFIRGIPTDLDESATMDGCGKYGVFFRIMLPLIVPALITAAIFQFYWSWDDFFGPLLYINKLELFPVSLALKMFSDPHNATDWSGMFAMSILSLLPVFLIFLTFQRFIVEGVSTTGIKS
jgi:multiple sugar transport system permease protein